LASAQVIDCAVPEIIALRYHNLNQAAGAFHIFYYLKLRHVSLFSQWPQFQGLHRIMFRKRTSFNKPTGSL